MLIPHVLSQQSNLKVLLIDTAKIISTKELKNRNATNYVLNLRNRLATQREVFQEMDPKQRRIIDKQGNLLASQKEPSMQSH